MASNFIEVYKYFKSYGDKIVKDLLEFVIILPFETKTNLPFSGKNIIFTGSLTSMSRLEAKAVAIDMGFIVAGSISSKLDYVVIGDDAGSKLRKAKELSLNIIEEEQWLQMVNNFRIKK